MKLKKTGKVSETTDPVPWKAEAGDYLSLKNLSQPDNVVIGCL